MYWKLLGRLRKLEWEKPKVILLNLKLPASSGLIQIKVTDHRSIFLTCFVTYYREHYFFCFANFLLGRDIYGPGKYIFGVFDNREIDHTYMVKYNEYDSE